MEDVDDDFGDLYADVEVQASSIMNTVPQISKLQSVNDETGKQSGVVEASCEKEDKGNDVVYDDDDDEDDLHIVLNSDDDNLQSGELEDEDDDDLGKEEFVGGKGVYKSHSQYKYVRSHSASYASDLKGNGCGAAAAFSYSALRGDREDNGYRQGIGSRSMGPQGGQRFSLPLSRTILDVNIDIFEQKPWMHPGADITDYFNFGLNEDSWKLYCTQVDEYRHREPMPSGIPVLEPPQLTERKGRAIQVENSIFERQSSLDLVRQLNRDSDVIQINVHNPEGHCSGPEASNHEDVNEDDVTDHLSFSNASEDESFEGNHKEIEIQAPKRYSNRRSNSKSVTRGSDNHEIRQISDEATGTSDNTQERACESCYHSEDSKRSDNKRKPGDHRYHARHNIHVYNNYSNHEDSKSKCHGENYDKRKPGDHSYHARHNNLVYTNKTHEDSHHENDKSCLRRPDDKRKPGEHRYHARQSSPVYNNRTYGVPKRKAHHGNQRLHAFDSCDEKNISCLRDLERPFDYYHERFSGYEDWDASARDLHRKGYERSEAKMDPFIFRSSEEEEHYGERRRYIKDDKVMASDWCHNGRELAVENVDFLTHPEFGWKNPENKSGAQWKRRDNLHFRSGGEDDDSFLKHEYGNGIQGGKFRSLIYNGRERDRFERGYVEHVAYTRWEFRGTGRNKRRFGSPPAEFNNLLPKGDGDRYLRYREDQSFASRSCEEPHINTSRWHCNMMPRNNLPGRQGRYRGQWTERFVEDDSLRGYFEPSNREDYTIDIDDCVDMGRRRDWQFEIQCDEDEILLRHEDAKFCDEGALFPFEKVSRRKRFVSGRRYEQKREVTSCNKFDGTSNSSRGGSHEWLFMGGVDSLDSHLVDGSDHIEDLIDDPHAEGWKYNQTREVISGNKFSRTSNVIHGERREQSSLSCRNSLNSHLVVGEGKRSTLQSSEPEKQARTDLGLEMEEGQIPTEELNTRPVKNDQNGKTGFDSARILEAMAKMEKRRARFNEPITKKDSDELTCLDLGQLVASTKQQRPVRKRRWGGS